MVDVPVTDTVFEQFAGQSNVRGISDRLSSHVELGYLVI
jgi:hypothetical protein